MSVPEIITGVIQEYNIPIKQEVQEEVENKIHLNKFI